ncbi:MAG: Alpha-methylacyl-CoA racemase, partial [uncultured Solirubrobacteraceae bacterium]
GDGRGAIPGRRRRAGARHRSPERRPRLLPPVPVRRRLGDVRRARAEVLPGLVPWRGSRGPDRPAVLAPGVPGARGDPGCVHGAHPRAVAGVRLRGRLLSRAGARRRRGAVVGARARARDGRRARPARRREPGQAARRPGEDVAHARRREPPARPRPRRAHRQRAALARLRGGRDRGAEGVRRGRRPGHGGVGVISGV